MPLRSTHWLRAAALLLSGLVVGPLAAQTDWPGRPVRIIVTFSTGGAADYTARVVGERLSDLWKQPVVVENRIGAGGNIGVEAVQRSTPDGHTLLLASSAQPINVALYSKLPFDLFRDFASIALVTVSPMALAVNPRLKVSTLREYTELVRASPGKMSYATCGVATSHHFAFELYKFEARLSALHIPYRGCAAAVSDAAGGQIDTVMSSLNTLLPHQATGRLRVLAITARNRSASSPEIPTFRESGVPELKGYESSVYYGFMAPAATPRAVIGRIESDLRAVMGQPEVGKRLATAGMEVAFVPGKEMAAILRSDADQIRRIVEFAGIKPE